MRPGVEEAEGDRAMSSQDNVTTDDPIASLRAFVAGELVEAAVMGEHLQAHRAVEIRILGDDVLVDEFVLDVRTQPATITRAPRPIQRTRQISGADPFLLALVNRARYRLDGISAVSGEYGGLRELVELNYRGRAEIHRAMQWVVLERFREAKPAPSPPSPEPATGGRRRQR